jgi:hypothetical protein
MVMHGLANFNTPYTFLPAEQAEISIGNKLLFSDKVR